MSARRKRKAKAGREADGSAAPAKPAAADGAGEARARTVFWTFAGALAVAVLVFFGSFVVDRGAMIFGTDMVSEAYQSRAYAVQEVEAGRGLPHWNPYLNAGIPFLSTLPYPVYYPTSLLYFAIPLHRAIGWAFVLHVFLAGLLMYALARELRLAPGPALVAGVAYAFTGYVVSHLHAGQDGRMFAMQWAPALFLCLERAIDRRSATWFLLLGLVVTLQVFTPHVQITYFTAMAAAAYAVFRVWGIRRSEGPRSALLLFGGFAGAYALAALLTAVQNWPTLDMLQYSHRVARDYAYASSWSMPVQETLAVIWPEFHGFLDAYWGTNPFKLHTEYLGAVPVFLALLALLARRTSRTWFFAGLALAALLFAWGGATPLHRAAYAVLPLMSSFRAPGMMFSVVALATVVLAALGAQALVDRRDALADGGHVAWKVLGGLGALWVVLWFWAAASPEGFASAWAAVLYGGVEGERRVLMTRAMPAFVRGLGLFAVFWAAALGIAWATARGRLAPLAACVLLAALALVDLWRIDARFYDSFEVERLTEPDETVRYLQARPEPFRVFPIPGTYGPNDLMLFRVPSVSGLHKFRLRWWEDLVGEEQRALGDTRLWALLDVRYLIAPQPLDFPRLETVHGRTGPIVYRWSGPAAGAWLVHATAPRPPGPGTEGVMARGFDPRRIALLEPGTPAPTLDPTAVGEGAVRWTLREPDRLALEVDAPGDALLVLSEVYHPYWSATVDGRPADVLQVDVALRAVPVPAGTHRVELVFEDPHVAQGMWASLAGVVLWVGLFVLARRREGGRAG